MDIRLALREKMPELPKKLALAARYALDHPDRVALDSMRSTATAVGVTSTTMLRLARQLGFENYDDFRAAFQDELVSNGFGSRAGALHDDGTRTDGGNASEKIFVAAETNISGTYAHLDQETLVAAVHAIRKAPACYVIGSGSLFWLASIIKTTGSMVLGNIRLVGAEFALAGEVLGGLTPDDVVICLGVNPCAARTIEAMSYAQEKGAQTIAITDRPSSPLAVNADYAFFAQTESPHYYPSMVGLIALVETLLATIVATGDGRELKMIERFETLRKQSASYVEY